MPWILAYDVACPRRWRRLYRLARSVGVRLQWSVFLVTQEPFDRRAFLSEAAGLIDPRADDVRLYHVVGAITGNVDRTRLDEPVPGVTWRGPPPGVRRHLRPVEPEPEPDG